MRKGVGRKPYDAPYDQFLSEYPTHTLAIIAHLRRIKSIYTQAKWMRERSRLYPEFQDEAASLFAEAAAVPRLDNVLSGVVPPEQLVSVQQEYELLVDKALLQAWRCTKDPASGRSYLEQIIQRNQTESLVEKAQQELNDLEQAAEAGNR